MANHNVVIEEGTLRHQLKTETKTIHDYAVKRLRQILFEDASTAQSAKAYKVLLLQYYVLYEALESELEANRDHPVVAAIHFPIELNRLHLVIEDLDHFYDNQWRHLLHGNDIMPATRLLATRIREVGRNDPELLLAHSYTRYLGDINGRNALRRMVSKNYALPEGKGVSFYSFEQIPSMNPFLNHYNTRMNDLPMTTAEKNRQVEESLNIYQDHFDMFEQIVTAQKPRGFLDLSNKITDATWMTVNTLMMGVSAAVLTGTGIVSPWIHVN